LRVFLLQCIFVFPLLAVVTFMMFWHRKWIWYNFPALNHGAQSIASCRASTAATSWNSAHCKTYFFWTSGIMWVWKWRLCFSLGNDILESPSDL
jgi:hypothetical protein